MAEQIVNEFTVNRPIDEAWPIICDLERIAPCLPGAQLEEIEGDTYRGRVKVKLGAITAQFVGEAHFVERDDEAHTAKLKGKGRDTGGRGNAEADISAQAEALSPTSTKCIVVADLHITGKVAQFGRGVLGDVSRKLLGQFVENLEAQVLAGAEATSLADDPSGEELPAVGEEVSADDEPATPGATSGPATRTIESPAVAPVDLLASAGAPVLKRALPLVGIAGAVLLLLGLRRRRRRSRG